MICWITVFMFNASMIYTFLYASPFLLISKAFDVDLLFAILLVVSYNILCSLYNCVHRRAACVTITASIGGGVVGISTSWLTRNHQFDIGYLINGVLGGLVGCTGTIEFFDFECSILTDKMHFDSLTLIFVGRQLCWKDQPSDHLYSFHL